MHAEGQLDLEMDSARMRVEEECSLQSSSTSNFTTNQVLTYRERKEEGVQTYGDARRRPQPSSQVSS